MQDQGAISAGMASAAIVTDSLSRAQVKRSAMMPAIKPSRALSVSSCRTRRLRAKKCERLKVAT
jgi:hypothetical protein